MALRPTANADMSSLLRLVNPLVMATHIWRQRDLITQLVRRDVGQRYRGSYLGILWSFITPLFMLAIYTVVFALIFKTQWRTDRETSTLEFALILFAGLAAFNLFSEVANRAPFLILQVPNYVKKVVFPLEVLPIVSVGSALVNAMITIVLVLIGNIILLGHVSSTLWLLPFMFVPLLLLALGLGWLLASLGVYIRDIGQAVGILVQMLFFTSGVFFSASTVPEPIRTALLINPLAFILNAFRQTLLWGEVPDMGTWLAYTLIGGAITLLGYAWFMRTKKGFADVL